MIMQSAEVPEAGNAAEAAEPATPAPTTSRRPDVVDKVVRAQCENSLVVGVYLLSCPLARRRLATFVEVADSVERWCASQSRRCRCVASNKEWLAEQASGKCMEHISLVWVAASLRASLCRQGFWFGSEGTPRPDPSVVLPTTASPPTPATWCFTRSGSA